MPGGYKLAIAGRIALLALAITAGGCHVYTEQGYYYGYPMRQVYVARPVYVVTYAPAPVVYERHSARVRYASRATPPTHAPRRAHVDRDGCAHWRPPVLRTRTYAYVTRAYAPIGIRWPRPHRGHAHR